MGKNSKRKRKIKNDKGEIKKMKIKNELKNKKGITLIALVITIIVLLILAGVTIATLTGPNGIITRANEAKQKTEEAEIQELRDLAQMEANTYLEQYEHTETINGKTVTVPIPAGFAMSNIEGENSVKDGLVIIDTNGNEYVWIPCTIDGADGTVPYSREETKWTIETDGSDNSRAVKDELTLLDAGVTYSEVDIENGINQDISQEIVNQINAEKASIEKYKGFYVGRYEVGKKNSKAVIKQDKEPYAEIEWIDAYQLAKGIGGGTEATTYLCSSYAWDTALKYIETKTKYTDYGSDINKYNENWTSKNVVDKYGNIIKKVGESKKLNTGLTTAIYNIYDMGGNVAEFTTELNPGTSESVVFRGSNGDNNFPAGYRWDDSSPVSHSTLGFRTTLFLK